jgi:hypothetical protein
VPGQATAERDFHVLLRLLGWHWHERGARERGLDQQLVLPAPATSSGSTWSVVLVELLALPLLLVLILQIQVHVTVEPGFGEHSGQGNLAQDLTVSGNGR